MSHRPWLSLLGFTYLDASDADTLPGCVSTLRSFSLERGKKKKQKDFPFLLDVHTHACTNFEVVAFFLHALGGREIAGRKTSYPVLFVFLHGKNDFSKVPKNLARYKHLKIK